MKKSSQKKSNKTNNLNGWENINTKNIELNEIIENNILDKDTIVISINTHGGIIPSKNIDLTDFTNMSFFQKVSLGTYGCINFLNIRKISETIFNKLKNKKDKNIDFTEICKQSTRKNRPRKNIHNNEVQKYLKTLKTMKYNSNYLHHSFMYPTSNIIKDKLYIIYSDEIDTDGIDILFDGKTKLTSLEFINDIFTFDEDKNCYICYLSNIINHFLSNGYNKILIYDPTCNTIIDKQMDEETRRHIIFNAKEKGKKYTRLHGAF